MTPSTETRDERQHRLQARHNSALLALAGGLTVVGLIAALVWWGILPAFLSPDFSRAESEESSLTVACPPEGASPVPFDQVTAHVYNASGQEGLAGSTAEALRAHGVTIDEIGNWPDSSVTPTLLVTSEDGLTQAYTLASLFHGAVVTTDDRDDISVDVVLGPEGGNPITPEAAQSHSGDQAFVAPADCE